MRNGSAPRFLAKKNGIVTAAALICLAVAAAIFASVLRGLVAQRRDTDRLQRAVQARWVAESAVQRAAAQLATNAGYTGELWQIPPVQLDGRQSANVEIAVAKPDDLKAQRSLQISALFPDDDVSGVRITKQSKLSAPRTEK